MPSASYAMSLPNKDNQFNSTAFPQRRQARYGRLRRQEANSPMKSSWRSSKKPRASTIPPPRTPLKTLLKRTSSSATSKRDTLMKGSCPASASSARSSWAAPEQCVDMAKKYVKESLGAAEGTENTAKLMEYIDKPGAIRLIFNTEKPIPVEAFDTLSGHGSLHQAGREHRAQDGSGTDGRSGKEIARPIRDKNKRGRIGTPLPFFYPAESV